MLCLLDQDTENNSQKTNLEDKNESRDELQQQIFHFQSSPNYSLSGSPEETTSHDSEENQSSQSSTEYIDRSKKKSWTARKHPNMSRWNTRNPAYIPNLRIVRNDIRRFFAEMFMNVLNIRDIALTTMFYTELTRPNCIFVTKYLSTEKDNIGPPPIVTQGPGHVLEYLAANQLIEPDVIVRMKSCQIRLSEDFNGAMITVNFIKHASRLYEIDRPTKSLELPSNSDVVTNTNNLADQAVPDFIYLKGFKWKILPSPMKLRTDCQLIMKLDEQHKIISFITECTTFPEP